MPFGHLEALASHPLTHPDVKDAELKVLIGPETGWSDHVMRVFTLQAGGYTPRHQHPWLHVNFILSGSGSLLIEGVEQTLEPGHYALIPPNSVHQFKAAADEALVFICIVAPEGHKI